MLAQAALEGRSNEIVAARTVLEMFDIKGMLVTADAMHCNAKTARAAWTDYRAALAGEEARLAANEGRRRAYTLRLPWVLGADFFLRHLIDGDPASNTLSWRWVAGLHTRGRAYAARAENIRRHTDGRFSPTGLNERPVPLHETEPPRMVQLSTAQVAPAGDIALLLHLDDLHPESLPLGSGKVTRVGGLLASAPDASARVQRADAEALDDALRRAGEWFGCPAMPATVGWNDDLPIVAAWAPVGPSADALPEGCMRLRRAWDELTWPRATRGYFGLRAAIPSIRQDLSLGT